MPVLKGDRHQLKIAFQHVLGNALKFQEMGSQPIINITADLDFNAENQDNLNNVDDHELVGISIQDNGIGIAPGDEDKIFDLFQKGQTKNKYPGAGVGLALVRKIAESHGGYASARSAKDQGSIIEFFFPMHHP